MLFSVFSLSTLKYRLNLTRKRLHSFSKETMNSQNQNQLLIAFLGAIAIAAPIAVSNFSVSAQQNNTTSNPNSTPIAQTGTGTTSNTGTTGATGTTSTTTTQTTTQSTPGNTGVGTTNNTGTTGDNMDTGSSGTNNTRVKGLW
jgi:hypothetical protein